MGHFNIGDKALVSDKWFDEYELYTVSEKEYHGETNIYYFKETNYSAFEEQMTLSEVKEVSND